MNLETNTERFQGDEITIRDNKFFIYPFPAKEAFRIQAVLLQKFGPALGELVGAVDINDLKKIDIADTKINGEKIGSALQTLFMGLDEDESYNLVIRLIKEVECVSDVDGKKQKIKLDNDTNFDIVFRKHIFDVYKLIAAILKVNYADFFVLVEGIGNRLKTVISKTMNENIDN